MKFDILKNRIDVEKQRNTSLSAMKPRHQYEGFVKKPMHALMYSSAGNSQRSFDENDDKIPLKSYLDENDDHIPLKSIS